jgi:hypothetical protein
VAGAGILSRYVNRKAQFEAKEETMID